MKVGIVASEFFEPSLGRMGGFGWAARQVARCFITNPDAGVEPVFVSRSGEHRRYPGDVPVHGTRLIPPHRDLRYARKLRSERFDLLLTIDYRQTYDRVFQCLPRTPIVIWVHDPRTPDDMDRVRTLRFPGKPEVVPEGLATFDLTPLRTAARWSRLFRRPLMFASPARFLNLKIPSVYGIQPERDFFLPNILSIQPADIPKSRTPMVIFLGRLDGVKRPWLFIELARSFPEVQFLMLGKAYVGSPTAWQPADVPQNVRMLGHVQGEEKIRLLTSAWLLVNTSIHESLAISFLEALMCETPVVSCVDPEQVASRFGAFVGTFDGNGLEALASLETTLKAMLQNHDRRRQLGQAGRRWVEETHSSPAFLRGFSELRAELRL